MHLILPNAVQVPTRGTGKIVRGKVGWALYTFYNLTLKSGLWIYIAHFCTTKLSKGFIEAYDVSCGRKGK